MSNALDLDDTLDADLARALRDWRHEQARLLSIPPFWILTNATMAAIAARRPTSLEALVAIPGMGKVRGEKYGTTILELVAATAGRPAPPLEQSSRLRPRRLLYPMPQAQQEAFLQACGVSPSDVATVDVEVTLRP